MKYLISIAVHNEFDMTWRCLESIAKYSGVDYVACIVDNGSDSSFEDFFLSDKLHQGRAFELCNLRVTILRSNNNFGYSNAHNRAITWFLTEDWDYLVVLNNDVEVCAGWLETMAGACAPGVGQVGVLNPTFDNALDGTGLGFFQPDIEKADYAEGSCFMLPRSVVQKLWYEWDQHLFDPQYEFAYFEDSDLSLTLKNWGYKLEWVELPMKHHRHVTTQSVQGVDLHGYFLRNKAIFRRKWRYYLEHKTFEPERALFIRKVALGDVIRLTAVIRDYAEKYPMRAIDVVTHCKEVFRNNPHVNRVMTMFEYADVDPKIYQGRIYDMEFVPERNKHLPIHEAYAAACGVGLGEMSPYPDLYPTDEELLMMEDLLGKPLTCNTSITVAFHIGNQDPEGRDGRVWPVAKFAEVARRIKEAYPWTQIIELGGNDVPTMGVADIDVRGKTNLQETMAILAQCDVFIGVDSAVSNMAMANPLLKAIILFGSQDPYRILLDGHVAIQADLGCKGCLGWSDELRQVTCYRHDVKNLCMEQITVEEVTAAAIRAIGKPVESIP